MATNISVLVKFSDNSFTYLRNAVSEDTLTEITTDASGLLNITGGLSVGQSNQGKMATHALAKVQTDSATTGALAGAGLYDPQGTFICPIQGGGSAVSGLPKLVKPVRMVTGVKIQAQWQAIADAVQIGSIVVYCQSGKCDWFTATAVDDQDVAFTNKDGSSFGAALAGQTVVGAYSTYSAEKGLADTGVADGVNAFFIESAAGTLKMMYSPSLGGGTSVDRPTPFVMSSYKVDQNDTATCRANV